MALADFSPIPIADLSPDIPAAKSVIHGIITLVWPYSSVNHTFSFLLVEPDFRLRRNRGQVRVSLRGSCARRVTHAGLVSGDEIYLAVDGAQWEKDGTAASTPGRGIEWQLLYTNHLRLERVAENGDNQEIDTSRISASPEIQASVLPTVSDHLTITQHTPKPISASNGTFNAWSSPIFIRDKRLPDIFPSKTIDDMSDVEEEWLSAPPAKKLKFGRKSDQWRFIERSPSPESDVGLEHKPISIKEAPVTVRSPPTSSSPISIEHAKSSGRDASSDSPIESPHIESSTKSGHDILAIRQDTQNASFGTELGQRSGHIEPLSIVQVIQTDEGSAPSDPTSLESATQTGARVENQLPIQTATVMEDMSSSSEPPMILEESYSTRADGIFEPSSSISNLENDTFKSVSFRSENRLNNQSQSLSLPQDSYTKGSIVQSSQTALSQSPKLHLEINIQSSTPLVQPISLDTGPLTPRLLPLLSPGLDLVSPLEQRHAPQPGNYFISNLQAGSELNTIPPRPDSNPPHVQTIRSIDSDTAESHGFQDPRVDEQLLANPVETEDTFFNHLLARYDQASGANLESAEDQPMSSSPMPIELVGEDEIETVDGKSYAPDNRPALSDQSVESSFVEPGTISQQVNSRGMSAQAIEDEVEFLEVEDPSIVAEEIGSTAEEQKEEDTQEEEERTYEHTETQELEDSSDDDPSPSGKWRDMTYKPSQDLSQTMERIESSPALIQETETTHFGQETMNRVSVLDMTDGALDQNTTPAESIAIQDTYYAGDTYKVRSSSPVPEAANSIEVVDLLVSDSSSSTPEPLESQLIDEEQEVAMEAAQESSEALPMMLTLPEEPETISLPLEEIAESSQQSSSNSRKVSTDDGQPVETQQQDFYTAPAEFEKMSEGDLTQIVRDQDDEHETQSTVNSHSGETIGADSPKPMSPTHKPKPAQPKQHPPRSSQRVTRSQSQQTADMINAEDGQAEEHLESISETKPESSEAADPAPQGIRTAHDYYAPLTTLSQYHNSTNSLLAVVAASSKPIRSTLGPRDFNQTIYLTAPHSQPNNDFTIAQIFRPYSSALPYPISTGAIILLKDFKVQSYKRKMSLLSTATSAWAVFDQASATNQSEMQVSITGPPVDFGGAERGIAWGLGKWWSSLDEDSQGKITSAATTAKDRAEAELEKKATTARKARETKASSQLQLQTTPRRQTRSQQVAPSSIPNTPSTHQPTPTSAKGRTRGSQRADQSPTPTPTPTRQRHNLRSSPQDTSQDPTHELRSGLVYSDTEEGLSLDAADSQPVDTVSQQRNREQDSTTAAVDNPSSSSAGVKTRSQRRRGAAAESSANAASTRRAMWHELRDGIVYKD